MINPDGHTYPREVSAPTMVGFAYGDYGLASTIVYLFAGGMFAGLLRRWATGNKRLFPMAAYILFALAGGVSAEGGFIGTIYVAIMSGLCCLPIALLDGLYQAPLYPHLSGRNRPRPIRQLIKEPA